MKSLRVLLIGCVGVLFVSFGLSRVYATPILMYHHINEKAPVSKMSVTPDNFERQMEFLKTHQYRVLPLSEYVRRIQNGEGLPRKSVVITFDDGYDDNITHAYPVLKAMRFPATFFVQLNGLGKKGYLTREDIMILAENGMEIGSHTLTHAYLPDLAPGDLEKELFGSKKRLEGILGNEVRLLSYPGGGWTPEVRAVVQRAGFEGAVSTHSGSPTHRDPYVLRRIRISRTSDNLFLFWLKCSGFYTWYDELRRT